MGTTLVRQPYCIILEAGGVIDKLLHLFNSTTEFLPTRSWGTRLLVKCLSWALVAALHAFLGNFKTTQLQRDQRKLDTHHRWLTHWRVWSFGWNKHDLQNGPRFLGPWHFYQSLRPGLEDFHQPTGINHPHFFGIKQPGWTPQITSAKEALRKRCNGWDL